MLPRNLILRLLALLVHLREGESTTAALMFAYSFLAMTAYNIVKPITRSKFIAELSADNLPWVQLGAGADQEKGQQNGTQRPAIAMRTGGSEHVEQAHCVTTAQIESRGIGGSDHLSRFVNEV